MNTTLSVKQINWLLEAMRLNKFISAIEIDPSLMSHIKPLDAQFIKYIEGILAKGEYDGDDNSTDIIMIHSVKDWYKAARKIYPRIKIDNTDQQYNRPYLNNTSGHGIDIVNNNTTFIDHILT